MRTFLFILCVLPLMTLARPRHAHVHKNRGKYADVDSMDAFQGQLSLDVLQMDLMASVTLCKRDWYSSTTLDYMPGSFNGEQEFGLNVRTFQFSGTFNYNDMWQANDITFGLRQQYSYEFDDHIDIGVTLDEMKDVNDRYFIIQESLNIFYLLDNLGVISFGVILAQENHTNTILFSLSLSQIFKKHVTGTEEVHTLD